jgi:hypothetical protein
MKVVRVRFVREGVVEVFKAVRLRVFLLGCKGGRKKQGDKACRGKEGFHGFLIYYFVY